MVLIASIISFYLLSYSMLVKTYSLNMVWLPAELKHITQQRKRN